MGDGRFRLGRDALGRFRWMSRFERFVWVAWAALQKRHGSAALQSKRDEGIAVANRACVVCVTGVARQRHRFNIPFGVARESNSLHSKRMKESSNQATEIFNEPVNFPATGINENAFKF